MKMVYSAIIITVLVVSLMGLYLIKSGSLGQPDYSMALPIQLISIFLFPTFVAGGYFGFNHLVTKIDAQTPVEGKLQRYTQLLLLRSACFELPFLFCFAGAMITGEIIFLAVAPIVLYLLLLLRPTVESVSKDLTLPDKVKTILES